MGRTNTRQQKRNLVVDPTRHRRPLNEEIEEDEELIGGDESKNVDEDCNEQDDQVMDQIDDGGSIPSTMGVRVSFLENETEKGAVSSFFRFPLHRAPSQDFRDFVIPQTPAAIAAAAAAATRDSLQDMQQDDDDISVLTEFSGMEEEEDASSQVTAATEARTVVTTTTGSTTIPTRNAGQVATCHPMDKKKLSKRRNGAVDKNNGLPPIDNSKYKRRRMR